MYLNGIGLGANSQPAITTCPHCSYLWDGRCLICEDDDPHPGCAGCVEGRPLPQPWYKSDFFASVMAATAITVLSSLIVAKLMRIKAIAPLTNSR